MRVLVLRLLLLVVLTAWPSAANAETAAEMVSACRPVALAEVVEAEVLQPGRARRSADRVPPPAQGAA